MVFFIERHKSGSKLNKEVACILIMKSKHMTIFNKIINEQPVGLQIYHIMHLLIWIYISQFGGRQVISQALLQER